MKETGGAAFGWLGDKIGRIAEALRHDPLHQVAAGSDLAPASAGDVLAVREPPAASGGPGSERRVLEAIRRCPIK